MMQGGEACLVVSLLVVLTVGCAAPTGRLVHLRLKGAIPTETEPRDVDIHGRVHEGRWTAAFATARSWNAAAHAVDASDLVFQDGALAGTLAVRFLPDAWKPKDGRPRDLAVGIQAELAGGEIDGVYQSTFEGTPVEGDVTGEAGPAPAEPTLDDWGLVRTFLPAPDGKRTEVVLRFETAGGKGIAVEATKVRARGGWLELTADRLSGRYEIAWPQGEPFIVAFDLARVGDHLGGRLVLPGDVEAAASGWLDEAADAHLANCPDPLKPFGPGRQAMLDAARANAEALNWEAVFAKGVHRGEDRRAMPYRLYAPPETAGVKRPLVVFLHGRGQRGTDNEGQVTWPVSYLATDAVQAVEPFYLLVPQAAASWGDVPPDAPEGAATYDARLAETIRELLATRPIDPARVTVTGLSMGGWGTCVMLARHGDLFAAGAPACGADPDRAEAIGRTPIWVWHGDADVTVPVRCSRDLVRALRARGASPRYTELPGVGHGVYRWMVTDPRFVPWLLAQRRAP